jgi:uncharacterized membrane protein
LLDLPANGERTFAILLARVLRAGVIASATIVLAGGVIYLSKRGTVLPDYRVFRGQTADLRSIRGILIDAVSGSGRGLIQLGLLVLIATPIVRVLCSVAGFARERDWLYVAITIMVLALLSYSLLS